MEKKDQELRRNRRMSGHKGIKSTLEGVVLDEQFIGILPTIRRPK